MRHPLDLNPRAIIRCALAGVLLGLLGLSCAQAAGTIDKLRQSGKFVIGYAAEGAPLSRTDQAGKVAGYAISMCMKVADAVKSELNLPALATELVKVPVQERFRAVAEGRIHLLCGAVPSLERRAQVSFSIPIGFAGVDAVVRSDAPVRLVQVLTGREPPAPVIWRGTGAPERRALAVVAGSTLEEALAERLAERRIAVQVVTVKDTAEGLQAVIDRRADAFFEARALLVDAIDRSASKSSLVLVDRLFRRELVALGLPRNDDDFRLLVDRALSRIYRSPEFPTMYGTQLKAPDQETLDFFQLMALPE